MRSDFIVHACRLCLLAGATPALGVITSGDIVLVRPGTDITSVIKNAGDQTAAADHQVFAFVESDGVLDDAFDVDVFVPFLDGGEITIDRVRDLATGTLDAGQVYESYFLHYDVTPRPRRPVQAAGSITFDDPILGLAVLKKSLVGTNVLGHDSVRYADGFGASGKVDFNNGAFGDTVSLSPDRHTLTLNRLFVSSGADQIRVITGPLVTPAETPAPSAAVLGLIGLSVARSMRRRTPSTRHH